jgi:hypothetical protein
LGIYGKADISLSTDSIFNFQEEEMKKMEQDTPIKQENNNVNQAPDNKMKASGQICEEAV